jgi:hypothetical protein
MNDQSVTDAQDTSDEQDEAPDEQETYEAHVRTIATEYEAPMRRMLEEIVEVLVDVGFECSDLYDMTDSEFSWSFTCKSVGENEKQLTGKQTGASYDEKSFDVQITINESAEHSGTYDGVNFSLNVGYWGGLIVGGCTPYNYTERVWVDAGDAAAVKERWREFSSAVDACDVAESILNYMPPEGG